jgi:hypothetical protein
MITTKKKSWQQKLNMDRQPHIEKVEKPFAGIRPGQMMLIPTPKLVDAYVRQIPEGTKVSVETLRRDLAAEYHAEVTCPLTTGIFLRIVSEAAYEEYENGKPIEAITPFWRVVDANGNTAKKLSFGTAFLKDMQKKEGIVTN